MAMDRPDWATGNTGNGTLNTPKANDLGGVSPLLGTHAAQQAVDQLARNVNALNDSLNKAINNLNRVGSAGGGRGFGSPATQSGGKPNGGGSQPVGSAYTGTLINGGGMPQGPASQTGGRGNGGWGAAGATAGLMASAGLDNMAKFVSANTTAQMLGRTSGTRWDNIRTSMTRNNYSADSYMDSVQGMATLGNLGYTAGSRRWNQATAFNKNFGLVDPSLNSTTLANAQVGMANPNLYYYMQGRGVSTIGGNGTIADPQQMANSMLNRMGGNGRRFSKDSVNSFFGASGGWNNVATSLRRNGASDDTIAAVQSSMRGQMTFQSYGGTAEQYRKAVMSGDTKTLERYGISSTDATKQKQMLAKSRNVEDNMATGFSTGLGAATKAVEGFATALDALTHGPLGDLLGTGQGFTGTLASGAGSIAGGIIGAKGLSMLGKYAMSRGAAGAAGRVAGAVGPRVAGALGGGGAAAFGGIAAGVALLGSAAYHASTDKGERAARDAAYSANGTKQHWWNNSWEDSFNNAATFGLTDHFSHKGKGSNGWRSMSTDGISGGASSQGGGSGGGGTSGSKKGVAAQSAGGATAAKVISIARRYIGVPYKWGGTTPKGFDCSGLMQYSFGQAGVSLPRTSQQQARMGSPVNIRDVRPGDLVFPADAHHVAMVVGPGKIIEAPRTGLNVRITSLRSDFVLARRVLGSVGDVGAITGDSAQSVSGDNRSQSNMPQAGGNFGVGGTSEADIVASALSGGRGGIGESASTGSTQNATDGANGSKSTNGTSGPTGPMPSGNVASWIKSALGILHLDYGKYASPLSTIIQHESGGNPRAINKWDSNWKAGHPSKGLMQTIDSTFNAHKMPGHGDIWNPVDNIIAATRYALSRYGTMDNVPGIKSLMNGGSYKGYAVGSTNIDVDQIAKVHKGETILDAQTAEAFRNALQKNTPTKGLLGGRGGGVTLQFNSGSIVLHASGPMDDSAATDFAKKFVRILSNNNELQTIAQGV